METERTHQPGPLPRTVLRKEDQGLAQWWEEGGALSLGESMVGLGMNKGQRQERDHLQ